MFNIITEKICDLIKKEISSHISMYDDAISCALPQIENHDYIIGVYLYDLVYRDALHLNDSQKDINGSKRVCKIMELSYMIYINESNTFGGFSKNNEDLILEEIVRIFALNPSIEVEDHKVHLSFEDGSIDAKIRLWQSFSKPLQPAVYLRVAPVIIYDHSEKIKYPVKESIVNAEKIKEV